MAFYEYIKEIKGLKIEMLVYIVIPFTMIWKWVL